MVISRVWSPSRDLQNAVAAGERLANIGAMPEVGRGVGEFNLRRHANAPGWVGEWRSRQGGKTLRCTGRGERQRAHDDAPCELDLEFVVAGRLGLGECRHRRAPEVFGVERSPCQQLFSLACSPGFGGDTAERNAYLCDLAAGDVQTHRGGDDGEGVRGAFAHLQIAGMAAEVARVGGQLQRDDQVARLEHSFPFGRLARKPVQVFQPDLAPATLALDLHHRIERDQRHAEVGWMGGDTGIAPAEYGM